MFAALQMMVTGGNHPPWSTVRQCARWCYTTSQSNAGLTNFATNSPGSTWTATASASGSHPKWWNSAWQPNGNGSFVNSATSANHTIGTNDFLIEWWQFNFTLSLQNNSVKVYMDCRTVLGTTSCPILYANVADGRLQYTNNVGADLIVTSANAVNITTPQLISICRASGTTRLFVDGTQVGSVSDSTNYVQMPIRMGNAVNAAGGTTLWIGEFRMAIGSGAGIRTANFTIPTGPFPIGTP